MRQGKFTLRRVKGRAFELTIEGEGSIYGSLENMMYHGIERGIDPDWAIRVEYMLNEESYNVARFDESGEFESCAV